MHKCTRFPLTTAQAPAPRGPSGFFGALTRWATHLCCNSGRCHRRAQRGRRQSRFVCLFVLLFVFPRSLLPLAPCTKEIDSAQLDKNGATSSQLQSSQCPVAAPVRPRACVRVRLCLSVCVYVDVCDKPCLPSRAPTCTGSRSGLTLLSTTHVQHWTEEGFLGWQYALPTPVLAGATHLAVVCSNTGESCPWRARDLCDDFKIYGV
jgi:hypothetical protein